MSCGIKITSVHLHSVKIVFWFSVFLRLSCCLICLGSFLFLNASERPSPVILSPWLRSSGDQCTVQVAVYKFYQQSGEYIARVVPIDESSGEILSVESPEKHG